MDRCSQPRNPQIFAPRYLSTSRAAAACIRRPFAPHNALTTSRDGNPTISRRILSNLYELDLELTYAAFTRNTESAEEFKLLPPSSRYALIICSSARMITKHRMNTKRLDRNELCDTIIHFASNWIHNR